MAGGRNTSSAAEVVLRERERERRRAASRAGGSDAPSAPALETVTAMSAGGNLDERELERRQRSISEQLERRQEEVRRTGRELARVRTELKALEAPIKAEIMALRERLEAANRGERALVDAVNALRTDLFDKEKKLAEVRERKSGLADDLIKAMADYERRKSERLEQIAHLVSDETPAKGNGFQGF